MKKKIVLLAIVCGLLLPLVGCGEEDVGPQTVSIVINQTAVFPRVNTNVFSESVYESLMTYGEVSCVVADGEPQLDFHVRNEEPSVDLDGEKRAQNASRYTDQVMEALRKLRPDEEETDTLQAIHVASATLRGSGMNRQTLLIVSSGLNTTGALNFAESDLLNAEPGWLVEQISGLHQIPNLEGIDVLWIGMGQTAGIQDPLDENHKSKLKDIWTAILEAGNPASLTIDPTPLADALPAEGLPYCTPVSVDKEVVTAPAPEEIVEPEEAVTLDSDKVIRIDETSVAFLSDTNRFAEPETAVESLKSVAELLEENPGMEIVLAGSTASVGGDGIQLSMERAEAVKEVLTNVYGIPSEQILCLGLGRGNSPFRTDDLDENGNLIEEKAALNRAVFLFARDSETARLLGL